MGCAIQSPKHTAMSLRICQSHCIRTSRSGRRCTYIMLWTIMDLWFKIPVESSFDSNLFVSAGAPSWTYEIARHGIGVFKGNSTWKKECFFFSFPTFETFHQRPLYSRGCFAICCRAIAIALAIATGHRPKFYFFNQKTFLPNPPKKFLYPFTH